MTGVLPSQELLIRVFAHAYSSFPVFFERELND
jgi:hypothetical protein